MRMQYFWVEVRDLVMRGAGRHRQSGDSEKTTGFAKAAPPKTGKLQMQDPRPLCMQHGRAALALTSAHVENCSVHSSVPNTNAFTIQTR